MFSDRLKEIRKECNLTQKAVYEKLNMSPNGYASYEQGRTEPNIETLKRLADCFGCSVDYILGRETENGTIIISDHSKSEIEKLYEQLNRQNQIMVLGYITALLQKQNKY